MRKRYNIYRATKEELQEQIVRHAIKKLQYADGSRELEAFIKGCNYILFRIRTSDVDPILLQKTDVINTIIKEK